MTEDERNKIISLMSSRRMNGYDRLKETERASQRAGYNLAGGRYDPYYTDEIIPTRPRNRMLRLRLPLALCRNLCRKD